MLSQAPAPDWLCKILPSSTWQAEYHTGSRHKLPSTIRRLPTTSSQFDLFDDAVAAQMQSVGTVLLSFGPCLVFILLAFSKLVSLQHLCVCKCDSVKRLFMALRPHCVPCEVCRDTGYLFIPGVCLLTYHPPPPPPPSTQQSKDTQPPPPFSCVTCNIDCLLYYIDQGVITCNNWMLN